MAPRASGYSRKDAETSGSAPETLLAQLDDIAIRLPAAALRVELWRSWALMARRDGAPLVKGNRARPPRATRRGR